jgi:hypothetical protein
MAYDGNEVSLHCTQTTKVAVFNGIGTSEERRGGPLYAKYRWERRES